MEIQKIGMANAFAIFCDKLSEKWYLRIWNCVRLQNMTQGAFWWVPWNLSWRASNKLFYRNFAWLLSCLKWQRLNLQAKLKCHNSTEAKVISIPTSSFFFFESSFVVKIWPKLSKLTADVRDWKFINYKFSQAMTYANAYKFMTLRQRTLPHSKSLKQDFWSRISIKRIKTVKDR